MRFWQWGTFDVANFGDLLFPLVAVRRLGGAEVAAVSPTASGPVWEDCLPCLGYRDVAGAEARGGEAAAASGVLLGGGHIVSWDRCSLGPYADAAPGPFAGRLAYPALWTGAGAQAARLGVPLCWDAPGVKRRPDSAAARGLLRACLEASDYVAVRDTFSRDCLAGLGSGTAIEIVPDTVLELASLWPRDQLHNDFGDLLEGAGLKRDTETLAVHVNRHYAGGDAGKTAAAVDQMAAATGLTPLLVALGPVHGDGDFADEVAGQLQQPHLRVTEPASLRQATAAVGLSKAYVGSSMHGMITALSFGIPGLMVAAEGASELNPKFTSLLEPLGLANQMVPDWASAAAPGGGLERTMALPGDTWTAVLPSVTPALDAHWERVGEIFSAGIARPVPAQVATGLEQAWQTALHLGSGSDLAALLADMESDAAAHSARDPKQKARHLRDKLDRANARIDELESHWSHRLFKNAQRLRKSVKKRLG